MNPNTRTLRPQAAALAFLTPRRWAVVRDDAAEACKSMVETPQGRVAVGLWSPHSDAEQAPLALLVHGWEGAASDLAAFVEPLRLSGYRVVAPDLPAHGDSEGERSSIAQAAEALLAVARRFGAPQALVAHSVGCAVAVVAQHRGLAAAGLALLATPARYADYAQAFGQACGLDHQGRLEMLDALRQLGVDVAGIDSPALVSGFDIPGLILHSQDDPVVPIANGRAVAQAWPGCEFVAVDGLGHYRLLRDAGIVSRVVSFVAGLKPSRVSPRP
ncbi:MAG: alpha/beta fold hydrolase [Pseudomonadota bacterium]|nr:alpha/beta fold hydrolase [Pseudomonadota bacterium]